MSTHNASANRPGLEVRRASIGKIARAGLVAIVAAVAANILARVILFALLPLPAEFPPLQIGAIAFLTTLGVGAGVVVYTLISRVSRQPNQIFTIVALAALVLSIIPNLIAVADPNAIPFPFPGATSMAFGALIVFHVIAGLIAIVVLTRVEPDPK
jgi:hypothetical protein